MSDALAGELNRYPGPMHVLELAHRLSLSSQQRAATEQLMKTHKAEARAIGSKVVEAEWALDMIFAEGTVTQSALEAHVRTIADLQAPYRLSRLETHRRMREVLTTEQVKRYVELRGYAGDVRSSPHIHGKHH